MVIIKANQQSEAGVLPSEKLLSDMQEYNEQLVKAGVMLAGEGLLPSSNGKRVRFSKSGTTVIDGPFAETKELIAGFWLWKVNSMEEAVDWIKKCPCPDEDIEAEIELRQVGEWEDFGDAVTPELLEKDRELREQLEGKINQV